jgi:hypothetical protein
MDNVHSLPAQTITREYPAGKVPQESVHGEAYNDDGDRHWYRFERVSFGKDGTVTATYTLDTEEGRDKAHKKWLRDTKVWREAKERAAADFNRSRTKLEALCGFGRNHYDSHFNPRDKVVEFLELDEHNMDDRGGEYLAFLEKIAPEIEAIYLKAAGFERWEALNAAFDVKFAPDPEEGDEEAA